MASTTTLGSKLLALLLIFTPLYAPLTDALSYCVSPTTGNAALYTACLGLQSSLSEELKTQTSVHLEVTVTYPPTLITPTSNGDSGNDVTSMPRSTLTVATDAGTSGGLGGHASPTGSGSNGDKGGNNGGPSDSPSSGSSGGFGEGTGSTATAEANSNAASPTSADFTAPSSSSNHYRDHVIIPVAVVCSIIGAVLLALLLLLLLKRRRRRQDATTHKVEEAMMAGSGTAASAAVVGGGVAAAAAGKGSDSSTPPPPEKTDNQTSEAPLLGGAAAKPIDMRNDPEKTGYQTPEAVAVASEKRAYSPISEKTGLPALEATALGGAAMTATRGTDTPYDLEKQADVQGQEQENSAAGALAARRPSKASNTSVSQAGSFSHPSPAGSRRVVSEVAPSLPEMPGMGTGAWISAEDAPTVETPNYSVASSSDPFMTPSERSLSNQGPVPGQHSIEQDGAVPELPQPGVGTDIPSTADADHTNVPGHGESEQVLVRESDDEEESGLPPLTDRSGRRHVTSWHYPSPTEASSFNFGFDGRGSGAPRQDRSSRPE